MQALYERRQADVDAILATDPDLDVFEAAALGRADRVSELVAADPSRATAYSADGFTALHLAAFFGKVEAARELLAAGASPHVYGTNGLANQPLHAAAAGRHVEVCRVLLAAGADVAAAEHGGFTPLHQAADHGDVEMLELFLSAGADPRAALPDGRTPADLARANGHVDVARRLDEIAPPG